MDLIDRELAIEWIYNWRVKNKYYHPLSKNKTIPISEVIDILEGAPSAEKTGKWIPVTERLPEEDKEVLISYRYKEGEGDTSHADIDITTYGQMYFGGNKVGNNKHWRAPFEYFHSNYEVIAWMPLPEPYKGQANCGARMEEG